MRWLIALLAALIAAPAAAHQGYSHTALPWTLGPEIVLPLLAVLVVFLAGRQRLRRRVRRGGARLQQSTRRFLAGWLVLTTALVSPLHAAGEISFAMHMVEHELIMLPAALLLVSARPGPALLWGLPQSMRRILGPLIRFRGWNALSQPVVATALQAFTLVIWHMPALFDRALQSEPMHIAQHASLVSTALLFWWAMLPRRSSRSHQLVAALCLFATSVVGSGLGALMALDASPWYAGYARLGMTPLGLDPVSDQQVAGLIMWVPGGMFHAAAALALLAAALQSPAQRLDDGVAGGEQAA